MPTYITLINFTEDGIKAVKDNMKLQQEAAQRVESLGAKVKSIHMTMGEYDCVVVYECDSDEIAVAGSLTASRDGHIRTSTMRAFTPEEFGKIVEMLP